LDNHIFILNKPDKGKTMKKSDITKIIREEVINIIREQYINEAFADPNIRLIDKMSGLDRGYRSFWTKFANTHDIAWDKLPKGTLNKVSGAEQAKKGLAFWVIKGRKHNPFSTDSWSSSIGHEGKDSILAVTLDNKIQYSSGAKVGSKGSMRYQSSHDAIGLGKRGTLMVKKLKELADEIYVMDFELFRGGTKALKAKRADLKLGKDTFKDARAWKQANLARYRDIMNARVGSRDSVDAMVAKIVKIANEAVAKGMEVIKIGNYDKIMTSIDGNEVEMDYVTSAMSRALRSYAEYIRQDNSAAKEKEQGYGDYNARAAKETAGYIKKILKAFESGNAREIGRY
jgi:hypothetical protein